MQAIPYFSFAGNAKEAIEFYKKAFNGETAYIMLYKENAELSKMFPNYGDKVLHATIKLSNGLFYAADLFPDTKRVAGNNVMVNMAFNSLEELEFAFKILKEGGEVTMELEDMFWGARNGSVTDKYGNEWSLNYQYK